MPELQKARASRSQVYRVWSEVHNMKTISVTKGPQVAKSLRLGPQNLAGIRKHFEEQRRTLRKKLQSLDKQKRNVEAELRVLEDGINWCEATYGLAKANANGEQQ